MNIKQYYLMHKNVYTSVLSIDLDSGKIIESEIINKEHAPIGHNNKEAFPNWWERRAIPKHQINREALLNGQSNLSYMMQNLGLSLVDCYWIKPTDSSFMWEDVNLYDHNFAENDFHFSDLKNISPFKPSATTQGELQKRWVIINGDRYLVKGNYGDMYRQSLNEVFVSNVHKAQNADYVEYQKIELPTSMGEGIGCISKNFTSQSLEFLPAYDITFYDKQPNDESIYQHYINTCVELGIPQKVMQEFMDYMILSDFIFTNTDRHLLNLGILRDPDTLNFVKPAPLFDTGNSMFYNRKYNPSTIYNIEITSFYKTETKFLEMVKNRNALNISKLPSPLELNAYYKDDPYSVVYLDNVKMGYEKKIELLDAYQRGYSLNPRSSNFYSCNILKDSKQDLQEDENEINL